jgi:hypothetical protein
MEGVAISLYEEYRGEDPSPKIEPTFEGFAEGLTGIRNALAFIARQPSFAPQQTSRPPNLNGGRYTPLPSPAATRSKLTLPLPSGPDGPPRGDRPS